MEEHGFDHEALWQRHHANVGGLYSTSLAREWEYLEATRNWPTPTTPSPTPEPEWWEYQG